MTSVRELHNEAMRLTHLALIARSEGNVAEAANLSEQAYTFEIRAANQVPNTAASEPTRSILYRGAASLAFQFGDLSLAQRAIGQGLAGYPPAQIKRELFELFQQVNQHIHLQAWGIELQDDDMQMALAGNAVGAGTILYDDFIERISAVKSLISRTVQRLMGRVYQRRGRIGEPYKAFTPALVAPRDGSFTITIKLVRPDNIQSPLIVDAQRVFDEMMTGFEYLNESNYERLRQHIEQPAYYQHFVSQSKIIAPDGDRVNLVGFTSANRSVGMTNIRENIEFQPAVAPEDREEYKSIDVSGILDYAVSRQRDTVGLTTDEGKTYTIFVEEGMDDLVKSYFKEYVSVRGITKDGNNIQLLDMQGAE